jgi:NAD(P)-dependent dehydrogenase (short-subunit alcohol dehydrogenase family)
VQVVTLADDRYVPPALLDGIEEVAPDVWRRSAQGGHWSVATHPERPARWVRELVAHVEGAPASRGLRRARIGAGADPLRHALVVITGTGSGFGRETALLLAARGAAVIGADIDLEAAQDTAAQCRSAGGEGFAHRVDVGDTEELEQFAKTVLAEHGVPDVVVNNAGFAIAGRALDMTRDDWDRILAVNLGAVAHGCRVFGQAMVERGEGGHIVNVASAAAYGPVPTLTAYATTKAAVLQLSRSLRSELACEGIGVSAVCPGFSRTGIGASARMVGRQGAEVVRAQRLADLGLRLRNLPPRRVAEAIIDAVERDRAVVAVGTEAHLVAGINRVAPRLAERLGDTMARVQHRFG